jgi:hypothetical protein
MLKALYILFYLFALTGCATSKQTAELTPDQHQASAESAARVAEYRLLIDFSNTAHANGKLDEPEWIKRTNAFNNLIRQEFELQDAITHNDPSVSDKARDLLDDITPALRTVSKAAGYAGHVGMSLLKQLAESNTTFK